MLKFLFGKKPGAKVETQRETFERLVKELNEAIEPLAVKPRVIVDPNLGTIAFATPEQFPDEALALPKPNDEAPREDQSVDADAQKAA
ncbi:MAG: hypothetical protein AAGA47_03665 [Pseudomonadota bacterium]